MFDAGLSRGGRSGPSASTLWRPPSEASVPDPRVHGLGPKEPGQALAPCMSAWPSSTTSWGRRNSGMPMPTPFD